MSFWLAAAYFTYDKRLEVIRVSIQVFDIALKATHHLVNSPTGSFFSAVGSLVEMIRIEMGFSVTQYRLNTRTFELVKVDIERDIR